MNTLVNFESALPSINGQFSVGVNTSRIQKHKDEIARDGINDQFISEFEIAKFQSLMHGYGAQAIDHAKSFLEDWHDQHYWKSKKAKAQAETEPENEDLVESST